MPEGIFCPMRDTDLAPAYFSCYRSDDRYRWNNTCAYIQTKCVRAYRDFLYIHSWKTTSSWNNYEGEWPCRSKVIYTLTGAILEYEILCKMVPPLYSSFPPISPLHFFNNSLSLSPTLLMDRFFSVVFYETWVLLTHFRTPESSSSSSIKWQRVQA